MMAISPTLLHVLVITLLLALFDQCQTNNAVVLLQKKAERIVGDVHAGENSTRSSPVEQLLQESIKLDAKSTQSLAGWSAPITQAGYAQVALGKNDDSMKAFIRRVLASEGKSICETGSAQGSLNGLTPFFSGHASTQSLLKLKKDLKSANWICKIPEPVATLIVAGAAGSSAPLTEDGYQAVGNIRNNEQMKAYMRRVLASLGLNVRLEGGLSGAAPYFSGVVAKRSFAELQRELIDAPWVGGGGSVMLVGEKYGQEEENADTWRSSTMVGRRRYSTELAPLLAEASAGVDRDFDSLYTTTTRSADDVYVTPHGEYDAGYDPLHFLDPEPETSQRRRRKESDVLSGSREDKGDFMIAIDGLGFCPPGYKSIGDESSCKQAMTLLNLGPFRSVVCWDKSPGGCWVDPSGRVRLNNNTGFARPEHSLLCERDAEEGVMSAFEARDADGGWQPVTVATVRDDGMYDCDLDDGTRWSKVWQVNLRRRPGGKDYTKKETNWDPILTGAYSLHGKSNRSHRSNHSHLLNGTAFIMGMLGTNACPEGFKGIGDPRTCKQAIRATGIGRWGKKVAWDHYPAGCFATKSGEAHVNGHAGRAQRDSTPVCEKDFSLTSQAELESRDTDGEWVPVTLVKKHGDGSYDAALKGGAIRKQVSQYNLRLMAVAVGV